MQVGKKIYQKKNFNVPDFKQFLKQQNSKEIYVQSSLESMPQVFTQNLTVALTQNAPFKKYFLSEIKKNFTLTDKWLPRNSQLTVNRDGILNDEEY